MQRSSFRGIRGVSIGKNAATPIESAAEDYLYCFRAVYALADYIAVNISSPNTSKLRELQSGKWLRSVVGPLLDERARLIREHGRNTPIFVKIAPDLTPDQLEELVSEIHQLGVDGLIATNTTVDLEGVRGVLPIHHGGGLSGEPLHRRSLAVISKLRSKLGLSFPIIGVGGITTTDAAIATLNAGANVIQLYTGFIYRGPALLNDILRVLEVAKGKAEHLIAADVAKRR